MSSLSKNCIWLIQIQVYLLVVLSGKISKNLSNSANILLQSFRKLCEASPVADGSTLS